jgi:hypothetical protein
MHPQITTPLTTLPLSSRQTANLVPYNSIHFSFIADNRGSKLTPKCIPESAQLWALATEGAGLIPSKSLHCRQQKQRADKRMHHQQGSTPLSERERERERAREIGIIYRHFMYLRCLMPFFSLFSCDTWVFAGHHGKKWKQKNYVRVLYAR